MINQQIQNYKIISLLGEGGMGDVYLAEHVSIKRKVAIKVLKPELHLLDKEQMLMDDITNTKNISDIESIKKYLNEK